MINALKTESYSPWIFANLLKIRLKAINSFLDKPRLKFSRISGKSGIFMINFVRVQSVSAILQSPLIFYSMDSPVKRTPRAGPCRFQYFFLTLYRWTGHLVETIECSW